MMCKGYSAPAQCTQFVQGITENRLIGKQEETA